MRSPVLACAAASIALTAIAGAQTQRVTLTDSVVPVLTQSKLLGAPPPSQILHLAIGLQPRYPAELEAFCDSVSSPYSPNYRQFMTPEQVGETFGASADDVRAAEAFLSSNGMKIVLSASNRMEILADATVAQAQKAFGVTIKSYQGLDPRGRSISFIANTTPITIPSGLSRIVYDVSGLETYRHGEPRQVLTPTQTRTLYGTAPAYASGFMGQGQTIAVSNFDGFRLSNIPLYISQYGLPIPAGGAGSNIQVITVGTGAQNGSAGGEGDLDIQMELGMAPLATILIYDSVYSNADLISVLTREVTDNRATVISESYGWQTTATQDTAAHNQHLAMTAQGITYMCASGDDGTNLAAPYTYPDYDPEVMMIGGTTATTNGSGVRSTEISWNGSSGGWINNTAPFNTLPSWQHGTGVPTTINRRLVPDLSLHASGSAGTSGGSGSGAYFFYYSGGLDGSSWGTSFASPVCTGCIGILEQRLAANGLPSRLGRMMDMIYAENGRQDVWFDITVGNNGILPNGQQSNAGPGWDTVTGWGAPNFDVWYNVLASKNVTGTVTLQNWTVSESGTPVTVQFYNAGTSTLVDTQVGMLNASGQFAVITTAPVGQYDIYVKASHWLRRKMANQTLSASGLSGLSYSLINGDVNGDNSVSLADFGLLRTAFGSSVGSGNWNPNADLNGDGSVGLGDFGILRTNFGLSGD